MHHHQPSEGLVGLSRRRGVVRCGVDDQKESRASRRKLVARNTVSDIRWGSPLDWGVSVWENCSEMTPRMYDHRNAFFICDDDC